VRLAIDSGQREVRERRSNRQHRMFQVRLDSTSAALLASGIGVSDDGWKRHEREPCEKGTRESLSPRRRQAVARDLVC
jgi:hypothetical protein